jgi:hypothetical protein
MRASDALSLPVSSHVHSLSAYQPFCSSLSECGHCYCEGCLKGWFDETLTKHIRAHATYDANRKLVPPNFPRVLPKYWSLPLTSDSYATAGSVQPEYTCPGCWQEITKKPVVNFVVRDMVSLVGSALGQPDTRRSI